MGYRTERIEYRIKARAPELFWPPAFFDTLKDSVWIIRNVKGKNMPGR